MPSEKTTAFVLRVIDFSETSFVVSLFTRDFGKISALAKGARRPKSSFEAALDLLSVCRIVFLHKSTDALDLLTEAKLERRFRAGSRDLTRLYAGYYVIELLYDLTDTADPHPDLFDIADYTLGRIDGDGEVFATLLRFEMIALRIVGHGPQFGTCVNCGAEIPLEGRIAFGQLAGGVLCPRCRTGQRQVVSLSAAAIGALRTFSAENDSWRQHTIERKT